jgi:hypothetical protein
VSHGWSPVLVVGMSAGIALLSCRVLTQVIVALSDAIRLRVTGAAHLVVAFAPAAGMASLDRGPLWMLAGALLMAVPLLANPWYRAALVPSTTNRGRLKEQVAEPGHTPRDDADRRGRS